MPRYDLTIEYVDANDSSRNRTDTFGERTLGDCLDLILSWSYDYTVLNATIMYRDGKNG